MSPGRRALGLRARLTLWYGGVLLVVLLLFSALSYAALRWTLLRDVDSTLLVVAQVVRDTGYPRGPLTDPEAQLRDLLGPDFYDRFLRLLDPEGALEDEAPGTASRPFPLSREARANAQRGVPTFETLGAADGEAVRVLTMPVNRGGRLVNLIQVGIPLRRTREALDRYVRILLALVPLGLGLAMVGGALVARRALAPVGLMSRTARRITAQDLTERIPARGAGDELDHLAETLNAMLARLEAAFVRGAALRRRCRARAPHAPHGSPRRARGRAPRRPVARPSTGTFSSRSSRARSGSSGSRRTSSRCPGRRPGGVVRSGPVDVEALVLGALDAGVRLAQGRGVTVRLGAVAPNAVQGDAVALERALLNLVDNAVRYTPAGGKVEISATPTDGWVEISVQDSGPGIAPADEERVFEPFVRLDAARAKEPAGVRPRAGDRPVDRDGPRRHPGARLGPGGG